MKDTCKHTLFLYNFLIAREITLNFPYTKPVKKEKVNNRTGCVFKLYIAYNWLASNSRMYCINHSGLVKFWYSVQISSVSSNLKVENVENNHYLFNYNDIMYWNINKKLHLVSRLSNLYIWPEIKSCKLEFNVTLYLLIKIIQYYFDQREVPVGYVYSTIFIH